MEILVQVFISILTFLCVALAVGFYTLMERKVLSYIQLRKGPNKVGLLGLPQPLADAAKLFTKENPKIDFSNKFLYMMSPVAAMVVMFALWGLYPSYDGGGAGLSCYIIFFLCVSSLNVYCVLLSGWSSNSKYSLLGAVRSVAQTISYEVTMALVILVVFMFGRSLDVVTVSSCQYIWNVFVIFPVFLMWFVTVLAETNRAPFDLAEGESELVSGFNIEYGGGEFAFLFIAEYGSILFMSFLTVVMFLGGMMTGSGLFFSVKAVLVAYCILWIRGSFPRMRYDVLMYLTWKSFLSVILVVFFVYLGLGVFVP